MHYYYKKKIRAQVIHAWKEANFLQRDKALRQIQDEGEDNSEELKEDTETKGIPFSFKMKISREMFSIESQGVKQDVEKRRTQDAALPELTESEQMRVAKLVVYQQYVVDHLFRLPCN